MSVSISSNIVGGGGLGLTAQQAAAGATGVIASDGSGNAFKQDGTAFSGGGATLPSTTNLLKGNGTGGAVAATPGTDYSTATVASTTNLLKGDGAGNAVDSGVSGLGQLLAVSTCPFGEPSSGSINTSAVFTPTTAFLETYGPTGAIPYDGIWLYFNANEINTGSAAGYWWCVASTTSSLQIYNNTLTVGNSALNKPPASPTAWGTVTGGTTVGGTTQKAGWLVTIPGGTMGANGAVEIEMSLRTNASSGSKSLQPKFGGSNVGPAISASTTSTVQDQTVRYFNVNNTSRQRAIQRSTTATYTSTQFPGNASANTTTNITCGVDINHNTATDWVVCQYASVRVWPSA